MSQNAFEQVVSLMDAANNEDPNIEISDGREWPKELLYSHYMADMSGSHGLWIALKDQSGLISGVEKVFKAFDRNGSEYLEENEVMDFMRIFLQVVAEKSYNHPQQGEQLSETELRNLSIPIAIERREFSSAARGVDATDREGLRRQWESIALAIMAPGCPRRAGPRFRHPAG